LRDLGRANPEKGRVDRITLAIGPAYERPENLEEAVDSVVGQVPIA